MIIKVKEQIEREMEITFPSYWKNENSFGKPTYYAFFGDKIGLCVSEGFTYTVNPEMTMVDFKLLKPCEKTEIEPIFIANQKLFSKTMNPIVIDLETNNPTEDLESLNKFEVKSKSVEMRHNFNEPIV